MRGRTIEAPATRWPGRRQGKGRKHTQHVHSCGANPEPSSSRGVGPPRQARDVLVGAGSWGLRREGRGGTEGGQRRALEGGKVSQKGPDQGGRAEAVLVAVRVSGYIVVDLLHAAGPEEPEVLA